MRTYLLVVAYFLLGVWTVFAAQSEKLPANMTKPVIVVISCVPARNLVLGVTNDGQMVKGPEDWSAECKITNGYNAKLFEGSYSKRFPQSEFEAQVYGEVIANDLANQIAKIMKDKRDAQQK